MPPIGGCDAGFGSWPVPIAPALGRGCTWRGSLLSYLRHQPRGSDPIVRCPGPRGARRCRPVHLDGHTAPGFLRSLIHRGYHSPTPSWQFEIRQDAAQHTWCICGVLDVEFR